MAKYVLVYKGGMRESQPTPEEQQQILASWNDWFSAIGENMVEGGNPFGPSMTVANDGTATEGAASALTGYTIFTADSLAAAAEMTKGCPILSDGGSVEVYETYSVM
jgi:hypothetical protein